MSSQPLESRYGDVIRGMNAVAGASALSIWLLMAVAANSRLGWILVGASFVVLYPFNILINNVLLERNPTLAEIARNATNLGFLVIACHFMHWPLPAWLFLPFTALLFNHVSARRGILQLVAWSVVMATAAMYEGVSFIYPLSFIGLAVMCAIMSKLRFEVVHKMFAENDAQRLATRDALETLNRSQARLSSLLASTDDAICSFDEGQCLAANNAAFEEFCRWSLGHGARPGASWTEHCAPELLADWTSRHEAVRRGERVRAEQSLVRSGETRVLEVALNPIFGENNRVMGVTFIGRDVTARKEAERRAGELQKQMLEVSRRAGMADVATAVLHNVGNVLNSINVSAERACELHAHSRAHLLLDKLDGLLKCHLADPARFLTENDKGRRVPQLVGSLAETFGRERSQLFGELQLLKSNIDHVKVIVTAQQSHAKGGGMVERVEVNSLVEDGLATNQPSFSKHGVTVQRELSELPPIEIDRHKLFQIVVNLLANASQAMRDLPAGPRCLTVRTQVRERGQIAIEIADTGVGIAEENRAKIFSHGFTTKKEGHGFGLHSSACAAIEIGGSLSVESAGQGQGACFTVLVPAAPSR